VVEESSALEIGLLQYLHGNTRWALGGFSVIFRRLKIGNHIS
jgi:hypothetical protein